MKLSIHEDGTRSELELDRPTISVGRALDNDIRLADTLVSRHHCRIERNAGELYLVDNGSANGTQLNGRKIERERLTLGDQIGVGRVRLVLEGAAVPASARQLETQEIAREARESEGPVGLRTLTGDQRDERDELFVFARVTRELLRETDLERLLRLIVDSALSLSKGERGFVLLTAPTNERAQFSTRNESAHLGAKSDAANPSAGASSKSDAPHIVAKSDVAHAGAKSPSTDSGAKNEATHVRSRGETAHLGTKGDSAQAGAKSSDLTELKVRIARSFDRADIPVPSSRLSLGIARRVLEGHEPLLSIDAGRDERFSGMASVEDLRLRSVMCLPIKIDGAVDGVLYVDNRLQENAFTPEDLERMELFANQAALAIRNARGIADLREQNRKLEESRRQIELLNEQLGRKVRDQGRELSVVRAELGRERGRYDYTAIVGASEGMRRIFQQLDRLIESELPVLIHGESGTGKELIARAIHFNGPRAAKPFVTENCAALPDSLLESELFGHARGAFTGAHRQKKGLIEQAHGGTLFLDEIGDMSAEMQKKLLRVLQEGEIRPVGSDLQIKVDVRLLAASHRDLEQMVREGSFREDLYYRVNVLSVILPSLRERREDIPLLAEHLLARAAREAGRPVPLMPHEVVAALVAHDWPGNVRELENEMRRIVVLAQDMVRLEHLSQSVLERRSLHRNGPANSPMENSGDIRAAVADLEKRSIEAALVAASGNKSKAAAELGISRFALQRKLDKYDFSHLSFGKGVKVEEEEDGPVA